MLEELDLPYELHLVNIGEHEQFAPAFLKLSPNNKIPAIVDRGAEGGPLAVFESGAILTYLADKTGKLLARSGHERYEAIEWMHWSIGGLGPMLGQLVFFAFRSEQKMHAAVNRFTLEADRLLGVLDRRLASSRYLGGDDYSIADIAACTWALAATTTLGEVLSDGLDTKPALHRWLELVGSRPAVQRGINIPAGLSPLAGKRATEVHALPEPATVLSQHTTNKAISLDPARRESAR